MSDWNESSRIRKDFRHSHDGPEVPRGHKSVAKKKTGTSKSKRRRRWCQGKVGKEHQLSLIGYPYTYAKCDVCNMTEYRLPIEALAQVYPRAQMYVDYHELCKEFGHTYKVCEVGGGTWFRRSVRVCEVCGKSPDLWSWEDVDKQYPV